MTENLKYYVTLLLLKALALLPLRVLYFISDAAYVFVYHVWHYRRRVTRTNIQRIFPDWSEVEQRRLERAFYHHLCDLFVETIKLLHMSEAEMDRRVKVTGMEHINCALSDGHPVFVMLGHYGNWEWVQQMERHLTVSAPVHNIYRPARTEWSNRLMLRLRSHFPGLYLKQKQAVRTVLQMAKEGNPFVVSFIADQHPNTVSMYHWTDFLGLDTAYVTGAEEIGQRIGAVYIYINVLATRRGYYHLDCQPILPLSDGQPYPYTRSYMRMLEANIRRQPEQWLWSHRRWLRERKKVELA